MAHFFYLYVRDGFIPNNLMSNFALCPSVFLVPHIFAWSFSFLLCAPVHFSSSPPLFHTQPRTHTHNSVTNNSVTHNSVCKYWKKLKCEVIWSFNFSFGFYVSQWWHMVPSQPPHFSDRDTIHGDDVEATNKHGDLPTRRALPSKDTFSGNFHITHTSINEQLTCPCPCRHFYFVLKGIQPERWLRIRKLEVQGPSNSYF